MGGQTSQAIYEITLREKFAKMNELIGTFPSGIQTRVLGKIMVVSLEGTFIWEWDPLVCPQTVVQLHR
jgi:hypothetical protein